MDEVVRRLSEERDPLIVTQNGEAKVIMQDVRSFQAQHRAEGLYDDQRRPPPVPSRITPPIRAKKTIITTPNHTSSRCDG